MNRLGTLLPILRKVYIINFVLLAINELVTGRKARFDLIPKDVYIQNTAKFLGEFVATELWEMFNCFADIGFGAAGDPEALGNTKEVRFLMSV